MVANCIHIKLLSICLGTNLTDAIFAAAGTHLLRRPIWGERVESERCVLTIKMSHTSSFQYFRSQRLFNILRWQKLLIVLEHGSPLLQHLATAPNLVVFTHDSNLVAAQDDLSTCQRTKPSQVFIAKPKQSSRFVVVIQFDNQLSHFVATPGQKFFKALPIET